MKKAVALLLCVLTVFQLGACVNDGNGDKPKDYTVNLTAMNTVMKITVYSASEGEIEDVANLMTERISEIESLFDANLTGSDINLLNMPVTEQTVSDETAEILNISKSASETTDGAFDITVMPVLKLWGFNDGRYGVAADDDIKAFLPFVNYKDVSVNGNTVTKSVNTQVSLGGIAKGYLGDELLKIAKSHGAVALLSLGGNIVLCGNKANSEKWKVGIQNPEDTESLACSFECDGGKSVVTSGAYERYFEYGGKEYHHIIDPKTGYPAESDLTSVTVIGENGALCDAYSTALFVMGKEKSVEFAKEHNEFEFVFISKDGKMFATDGVENIKTENNGFTIVRSSDEFRNDAV